MFHNPVIRGVNADPSVCRAGDDYYLACSSLGYFPGLPIYHSRDLINWRLISHALTRPSQFCSDDSGRAPLIFAPTLRFHNGIFYLITTNVHGRGNFYVTATDAAGPWSEPIWVDADVFDPSLFFDGDGKVYFTRRNHLHIKDVVQAEINIETGELLTPLRSIGVGMVSDDAEAPHLYHIGDWYYLLLAEGGSRFHHMGTLGRSKNPYGPFEPCPHNPIISQREAWWHPVKSVGHGDLIEASDGSWWIVFLATRHCSYNALTILGRETFLAPVQWREGWPFVEPSALRQFEVDAPTLPLHPWPAPAARDDFDDEMFGLDWMFTSAAGADLCRLGERRGWVRLHGNGAVLAEGKPSAFMAKRQTEFDCSIETLCEFEPHSASDEAGVTVFGSGNFHYDAFLTLRDGKRSIVLRKCVGDIRYEAAICPVPAGAIRLRIAATPERYEFSFASQNCKWQILGAELAQLLASEVAGNWNGVLLGIYSSGLADFDWLEYQI